MAYVALYRKWRPQNFDSLVGQQPVKTALTNALTSGRIAHAYLFAGPRGTGKTSTARILAKALNCEQGPTPAPCGCCDNCVRIAAGTSMDVFEIDAASNRGIDEIKALRDQLAFTPVDCRYKVYIIDEVHMLTTEAFNALLKTLEEPPPHVIFILATTDPHRIPATIHSRCQRFDFRRVTVDEIAAHLALVAEGSGITADAEALRLIAIQSEGGMRDALSLLDQCGVMARTVTVDVVREVLGIVGREALRELVGAIGRQDLAAALGKLNQLLEQGKDVGQVLTELAEYLRALLLYQAVPGYDEVYLTDTQEAFQALSPLFARDRLLAAEERLHAAVLELKGTLRPKITAELCLLDLCRIEGSTLAALTARVEQLERRLAGGAAVPPAPLAAGAGAARTEVQVQPKVQPAFVPPAGAKLYTGPEEPPEAEQDDGPTAEELGQLSSAPPINNRPPVAKPVPAAKAGAASQKVASQVPAQSVVRPTAAGEEYGGDWAAGDDFWKQTLELVRSEKKMSMYSCAKDGRVYSFSNDVLVVAFKAPFKSERMNKDDFRSYFEEILLRLARRPLRLQCAAEASLRASGGAAAGAKAQPAPPQKEQAPAAAPQQLPDSLRKAMDAFGGTITEL
ncbi:MAG: DNA polymerase III subunit gamma/tau [Phascolarctobacterium sp.]|uniref:DNA polymerase III subunit gamma/tau n=1 Tax=Phascolarctobacterium sp. TaxID=2049039 RepID=UPI0026DD6D92|nr:DNA polymerase III subunit gamma/tau [Phascolarctobacterium sp.]MDO4920295.1 DNA polymerase III subunit gamma/tau [Phascolarctobacterium sp.]